MRKLSMFRDQLTEDRIRNINRLHRELKIYFLEYMDAFGKIDGTFALEVLKVSCIPSEITELGTEGLRNIWHEAKQEDAAIAEPVKSWSMQKKA